MDKNKDNDLVLNIFKVDDLLPHSHSLKPSKSTLPLTKLSVSASDKSIAFARENDISKRDLRKLIAQAKQAYLNNKTAEFSKENTGAAVLLSNGEMTSAARFEDTNRWSFDPADIARINAFQSLKNPSEERLMAVAYYGDGTYPDPSNIGKMAQQGWGGTDTLVALVQNDSIEVKTLNEYSTEIYISSSFSKQ